METGRVQNSPLELTSYQLAWLKELGIVKPWLPGSISATTATKSVKTVAPIPPATHLMAAKSTAAISSASQTPGSEPPASQSPSTQTLTQPSSAEPSPVVQTFAEAFTSSSSNGIATQGSLADATDLKTLEAKIRQCESCGLCRERTHAVPGQGVMRPSIMVVGEAPGEQEDRQGLPFVGRSGQLLDNMLAAIAHRRDTNVYITNVVKCRPPGNRNPDAQEIASCSFYLTRQIELIQPQAILAMGRFAAQTLLKKEVSMQALRGQVHFVDVGTRQIPVLATYHPAYLLRRPVEKASAWQDLKRIEAVLVGQKS